jgi:hypothetical protein
MQKNHSGHNEQYEKQRTMSERLISDSFYVFLRVRRVLRGSFVFCVVFAVFVVVPSWAQTPPFVLKFDSTNGDVLVSGFINGKPSRLLVDTGSGVTVLLPETAKRLGVKITKPETAFEYAKGTIQHLRVPPLRADNLECEIFEWDALLLGNDSSIRPVDGVIGMDVLSRYAIGLDFKNKTLWFWKGGNVSEEQKRQFAQGTPDSTPPGAMAENGSSAMQAQPLSVPMIEDMEGCFWVDTVVDQVQIPMLVDLGASDVFIARKYLKHLKPLFAREISDDKDKPEEKLRIGVARQLKIGGLTVDYPRIDFSDRFAVYGTDGILGISAFHHHRIILDYPAAVLSIFPSAETANALETLLHRFGIFTYATKYGTIAYALTGSPAYRAGMRSQFVIKSINGQPLKESVSLHEQMSVSAAMTEKLTLEILDTETYRYRTISLPASSAVSAPPPTSITVYAGKAKQPFRTKHYDLPYGGVWLPPRGDKKQITALEGKTHPPKELYRGSTLYIFKSGEKPVHPKKEFRMKRYPASLLAPVQIPPGSKMAVNADGDAFVFTPWNVKR